MLSTTASRMLRPMSSSSPMEARASLWGRSSWREDSPVRTPAPGESPWVLRVWETAPRSRSDEARAGAGAVHLDILPLRRSAHPPFLHHLHPQAEGRLGARAERRSECETGRCADARAEQPADIEQCH